MKSGMVIIIMLTAFLISPATTVIGKADMEGIMRVFDESSNDTIQEAIELREKSGRVDRYLLGQKYIKHLESVDSGGDNKRFIEALFTEISPRRSFRTTQRGLTETAKRGFIKKVNITTSSEGGGSRPEVVATKKRVFVIYHGNIKKGRRPTFNVKIFDSSMEKEILTRVLINSSRKYGNVTDSRVASDGKYLYLFYETANMRVGKSFLWGAKYKLDDSFKRVAYTHIPIVTSVTFNVAEYGDEKLDDPAPVVSTDFVFVITRYKTTFKKSGKTIYKVRKFNKELKKLKEFDIDLTSVVDGQARQMSVVYHQDYFYMVTPTTVGEVRVEAALATPSDIVLVKFDKNWKILWSKTISAEPDDTETYVTGFKMDKNRLYITYNQRKFGISSPLKIYDHKFHQLRKVKVASLGRRKKRLRPSFGEGLRPSLDVFGNRIFLGNNEGENAVVYIYDKNKIEE